MRGFKRDNTLTAIAREGLYPQFLGVLSDPRSFVSLPKITGHTNGKADPHLVLYGRDKAVMRRMIFDRNRLNNRYRCEGCGSSAYTDWILEWDHINNTPAERCDCAANAQILCQPCHRNKHVQVKFL